METLKAVSDHRGGRNRGKALQDCLEVCFNFRQYMSVYVSWSPLLSRLFWNLEGAQPLGTALYGVCGGLGRGKEGETLCFSALACKLLEVKDFGSVVVY